MSKILLIEDDPLLVDIYTTKLKEAGFEVISVQDGDQAVKTAEKERPDAILLDIVLPHVDGWEILSALREQESTKKTKLIILSNLGQKEEIAKGLALGANRYLIKAHYTPSQVASEVQKVIVS